MNHSEFTELMQKIAAGDTEEIKAPPEAKKQHDRIEADLAELFQNREGFAQRVKGELSQYFNTASGRYATREQSLTEKVASVLRR